MRKLLLELLIAFSFLSICLSKRYTYFTYQTAVQKMTKLAEEYPRFIKLYDVRKENNNIIETSCGDEPCKHWYFMITDWNAPQEKINTLPQVLLHAGIHGDEVIGTNTLLYMTEYIMQKNGMDDHITNLLKTRLLILVPMVNPSGFFFLKREERQGGKLIDPNRDFPYNLGNGKCLTTAAARVINHLFKKFLVQATITFHGGEHSITYPWGAWNHIQSNQKADESPDDQAFADIAKILSREAGSNPSMMIPVYPTGKMTDVVYAVNGGFEDWVYGASWESQFQANVIPKCDNVPAEEMKYNFESLRALVYLVETSYPKIPAEAYLGSSEGLDSPGNQYSYGHIAMNIRLSLALLDVVEPYVILKDFVYTEENKTLVVRWQGGGCKYVNSTNLFVEDQIGTFENNFLALQGPGYLENSEFVFQETLLLNNTSFDLSIGLTLTCDQNWDIQKTPKPNTGPKTHVAQARINESYHAEANGYTVSGKKFVHLNRTGITHDYLVKLKPVSPREIGLQVEFVECSTMKKIGALNMKVLDDDSMDMQYKGGLKLRNGTWNGHLYQFGDLSFCENSIGEALNIVSFQPDQYFEHSVLFEVDGDVKKEVQVDQKGRLSEEANVFKMIGRSIQITDKNDLSVFYVGQIALQQPDSCKKNEVMSGCVGFDLKSRDAICSVNLASGLKATGFKLFIESSDVENYIAISGFIPESVIVDENIVKIFIRNEKIEQEFSIDSSDIKDFDWIEKNTFPLDQKVALGTILRLYVEKSNGQKSLLGDCSVSLRNSSLNVTEYTNQQAPVDTTPDTPTPQEEKVSKTLNLYLVVFLIFGLIFLAGVVLLACWKVRTQKGAGGPANTNQSAGRSDSGQFRDNIELVENQESEHDI